MRRGFLIGLLGLVALASCSVKEDRSDCPCWLTVRASYPQELVSAWFGTHTLFEGHDGELIDCRVPRGIVEGVASTGDFSVQEGQQMAELFASVTKVNTVCEETEVAPQLHKQFARVDIDFKDEDDGRTAYDLLVTGNVSGSDKRTLEPLEGAFRCAPEPIMDGRGYEFRVPRQKDETLRLELSYHGNPVETIDLGYLIGKTGFDWKAENLGDVSILCDLPAHTFTITVMEWEGPVTFNITI